MRRYRHGSTQPIEGGRHRISKLLQDLGNYLKIRNGNRKMLYKRKEMKR